MAQSFEQLKIRTTQKWSRLALPAGGKTPGETMRSHTVGLCGPTGLTPQEGKGIHKSRERPEM